MWARAIAMALGVAGVVWWVSAPFLWSAVALGIAALCAAWPPARTCGAFFLCGALLCGVQVRATLGQRLDAPRRGLVEGCVDSAVRVDGERLRFDLAGTHVAGGRIARRVRLSWYGATRVPAPGECWRFEAKLRPPRGLVNPHGDDFERYAFVHKLSAFGYVTGRAERLTAAGQRKRLLRVRLALAARVRFAAGEGGHAPFYLALTVGLRHAIGDERWRVLNATGTSHLLAISGLHVGLSAGLGFAAGRFVVGPLLGRRCARSTGWALAVGAALAYAALAGFSLPTQRALTMVCVFAATGLARRHVSALDALALSLCIVLLLAPLSILSAGLWLSFGAVGALLTLRGRARGRWWGSQVAVFVGLAPVLGAFVGRVSLISPLANAVCVPLFSALVIPAVLASAALTFVHLPSAMGVYRVLDALLGPLWQALVQASALDGATHTLATPAPWRVALALAGVAALLTLAQTLRARLVAALACVPLLLGRPAGLGHGGFVVDVYDVGQALAVSIRTRHHSVLYDAGARWRSGDAGERVVLPQLDAYGVRAVEVLVVSHADMDHRGGVASLRATLAIGRVYAGEPAPGLEAARACRRGERFDLDGVAFEFLHPTRHRMWSGNNASCVLRVRGAHGRVLLTGDAEGLSELALLDAGDDLAADVVIGQHHGSRTSSTAAFVAATTARFVLLSTGFDNRWGLPAPAVVGRWEAAGATVLDTATHGALTVSVGAGDRGVRVAAARKRRHAVWRL